MEPLDAFVEFKLSKRDRQIISASLCEKLFQRQHYISTNYVLVTKKKERYHRLSDSIRRWCIPIGGKNFN